MKAKYKVGDVLIPKLAGEEETRLFVEQVITITCFAGTQIYGEEETRLFVEQVITITCFAGTQIYYEGKIWVKNYGNHKSLTKNSFRLNEIEIIGRDMAERIDNEEKKDKK